MKLNSFDRDIAEPDPTILRSLIVDYREFVGKTVAFHIEYDSWPHTFKDRTEELDFQLAEFSPEPYEGLEKWHDEAVDKLVEAEMSLNQVRVSRNLWRLAAILLLVPYLLLYLLWSMRG